MTLVFETDRSLPLVQLAISCRTGAGTDPEGKEGLARLAARLMRRTGAGLAAEVLDERIDSLGASLGVDVGTTSSGFAGSVITRSLDEYAQLVAGVVSRPGLALDELERLKRETIDELIELEDSDRALVQMWFRTAMFMGHGYGRSSLGTKSSVANIEHDDVVAHVAETFVPDNLVFALAGDVDRDTAERLTRDVLSALPSRPAPRDLIGEPAALPGRRLLFVDKPERTQTQILIGGLGTHPADEDHTALLVANTVFGGTFTARLTQEVRAKRGWSYGAYSNLPYDRRRQAFSMWTFPAATDAAACIALELELLEQWVNEGITQEELDWAKHYLVRSNVFSHDTAAKRMSLLLDEQIYDLPPRYHAEYPERVTHVTLEQANRALRQRLSLDDLLVTVVGTHAEIGSAIEAAIPRLGLVRTVSSREEPHGPW